MTTNEFFNYISQEKIKFYNEDGKNYIEIDTEAIGEEGKTEVIQAIKMLAEAITNSEITITKVR